MSELIDIFVPLEDSEAPVEPRLARALAWGAGALGPWRVVRRSLDARKGRPLGYRLRIEAARAGEPLAPPLAASRPRPAWPAGRPQPRVVIVGSGPAGSWAALRLSQSGVPSTIVELGKPVQPRRRDLALANRGQLDPASNYCFGEGGAGTYSDGKLYTRSKDRQGVAEVLADLVRFGGPPEIEADSRPHVGSNRLPKVLTALREQLEAQGVTYLFGSAVAGLRMTNGRVCAVRLANGGELPADVAVLAVGHSARAVYQWAAEAGVAMERKPTAVGVRLEHPQAVIDQLQYGRAAGHPKLPAAFYEVSAEGAGRGVYSFCMCPGGWMVPAATEPDGVVVNGMSLSRRDSPFANSGLVVAVQPDDFGPAAAGPLAGVEFQRDIERAASRVGGSALRLPAQRLTDFLKARGSTTIGDSSYRPGLVAADLSTIFPPVVLEALRAGLQEIVARLPSFLHQDAVLVAPESRTSSPVRLLRDPVTLQSPSIPGLYPAGEGAGYAGGIVSAALDGARIADSILAGRS